MKKSEKTGIPAFLFLLVSLILLPSVAQAVTYEYKQYTVQKGDTLWKISRAHLKDSFQWPLIWKENLRINNPDLIYPGQEILIPVRIVSGGPSRPGMPVPESTPSVSVNVPSGMELPDESLPPQEESLLDRYQSRSADLTAEKVQPLVTRQVLYESGYITKFMPDAGSVAGSPNGRFAFGLRDIIYIATNHPTRPGEKFFVLQRLTKIEHPVTEKALGSLIKVVGIVEVTQIGPTQTKATVIESYDLMNVGDMLDYYNEIMPPFAPANPRRPDIKALVLTSNFSRIITGGRDVIFIDKGMQDGLVNGDLLMTLMSNTDDTVNGIIQVVNVRSETSLALVLQSIQEINRGDTVRGLTGMFENAYQIIDHSETSITPVSTLAP